MKEQAALGKAASIVLKDQAALKKAAKKAQDEAAQARVVATLHLRKKLCR